MKDEKNMGNMGGFFEKIWEIWANFQKYGKYGKYGQIGCPERDMECNLEINSSLMRKHVDIREVSSPIIQEGQSSVVYGVVHEYHWITNKLDQLCSCFSLTTLLSKMHLLILSMFLEQYMESNVKIC